MKVLAQAVAIAAVSTIQVTSIATISNAESFPNFTLATTLPETGDAAVMSSKEEASDINPIPAGATFDDLGAVLKEFAKAPSSMRGAQEIAIYRQAAPAVVLLKTKEGSGSGVVLQNGMILTNRHVVEGVGTVQIFFKPTDTTQS